LDDGTHGEKSSTGQMTLILRKSSVQARLEGLSPDIFGGDNYSVVDGETCVGRIYPERIHGEMKWRWFLQTVPAPAPNSGVTDTREEAKTGFKQRYLEVKGGS
jgi:hypothetical protein